MLYFHRPKMAVADRFGRSSDKKITYKPITHARAVRYATLARTLDQEGFDSGDEMISDPNVKMMNRLNDTFSKGGETYTGTTSVSRRHKVAFDLRQAGVFLCTKNGQDLQDELDRNRDLVFRTHGGSFAFMAGPYRSYSPFGRKLRGGFIFVCLGSQVPGTYMSRFHGGQTGDMTGRQLNLLVRAKLAFEAHGDDTLEEFVQARSLNNQQSEDDDIFDD